MKRLSIFIALSLMTLQALPAYAGTYQLTIRYDFNIAIAFAGSEYFIEDLDAGEQTCDSVLAVASLQGYDPANLDPILDEVNYRAKNESGKVISSGKFRAIVSRPGGMGSAICRVQTTIKLPKAKFYDLVDSKGNTIIAGLPLSKFKKGKLSINIFDWN